MYHGSKESCESKLKGGGGWVINKPLIQNERKSNDEYVEKKTPNMKPWNFNPSIPESNFNLVTPN